MKPPSVNDGERTACGVVNDSAAHVLSPRATISPVVKVTQLGTLNKKFVLINPGPDAGAWPPGQDSAIMKLGKHKFGDPVPTEALCTETYLFSKIANVVVFAEIDTALCYVGYVRYVNTRKEIGTAATKTTGVIS